MRLDEVQKNLAASLTGRTAPVEGLDPEALDRARRSLEVKRRQAAAHLLPRLRGALGTAWPSRFREHAERYTPSGMLHHVDDAWELAELMERSLDPRIAGAAHDDLVSLRLRYTRDRRAGADRIRERLGPFVALMRTPARLLVVRMPGPEGKVWYLKV